MRRLQRGRRFSALWMDSRTTCCGRRLRWSCWKLVEPAVLRATHLREWVVAAPSSEEADRYLDEATRATSLGCLLRGQRCAVQCLKRQSSRKLPASDGTTVIRRYRHAATLGNLLHEVNNNLRLTGIDGDFPALANKVNDVGKKAVHHGLPSEDEARECLQNARRRCNFCCAIEHIRLRFWTRLLYLFLHVLRSGNQ